MNKLYGIIRREPFRILRKKKYIKHKIWIIMDSMWTAHRALLPSSYSTAILVPIDPSVSPHQLQICAAFNTERLDSSSRQLPDLLLWYQKKERKRLSAVNWTWDWHEVNRKRPNLSEAPTHTHGWNHSKIWHRKCFPKVDWPKCTNTPHTLFLPLSLIHQVFFFSWIGEKPKRSFSPYRWRDSGRNIL